LLLEAEQAECKADFVHQIAIALKETNETDYRLELLHQSEFVTDKSFESIQQDSEFLIKLLVAIVKTSLSRQ